MAQALPKLPWFPLYHQKFLSSASWLRMSDRQRGWYIQLLLMSANSPRPGYLLTEGGLSRLAGAEDKQLFEQESALVLAKFKTKKTKRGMWIYNPELLEVLKEQADKHEWANRKNGGGFKEKVSKKRENLSLSLTLVSPESLNKTIEDLFDLYVELFKRDSRYKLTESRWKSCANRLLELLKANNGDLEAARQSAHEAMLNLKASDFHVQHGHTDWLDHIFKSEDIFQKRIAMRAMTWPAHGNCDKHPDSGLTAWGACGGCYFTNPATVA